MRGLRQRGMGRRLGGQGDRASPAKQPGNIHETGTDRLPQRGLLQPQFLLAAGVVAGVLMAA